MLRQAQEPPQQATTPSTTATKPTKVKPQPTPLVTLPYTADEVARAIGELERERAQTETTRNPSGRITDILITMNIPLPPEAVAAKIDQFRVEQARERKAHRRQTMLGACSVLAAPFLLLVGYAVMSNMSRGDRAPALTTQIVVTDRSSGSPTKKTLAEVQEGIVVSVSSEQLARILGAPEVAGDSQVIWKMFKKKSVWYVQAYTDTVQSQSALMASERTSIQNAPDGLPKPVPIQVPVNDIRVEYTSMVRYDKHVQSLTVRFKKANLVTFQALRR